MPTPLPTPLGSGDAPPLASAAMVAFSADERLFLMILGALRQHAATSYPSLYPTLRQLAESVSLSPLKLASRLKKLASSARFLEHAVPLLDKHLDSPIACRADADGMACRPSSVELLVRTARTDKKRLIARKDLLKKAAAAIRPALQLFLDEQLAAGGTPRSTSRRFIGPRTNDCWKRRTRRGRGAGADSASCYGETQGSARAICCSGLPRMCKETIAVCFC